MKFGYFVIKGRGIYAILIEWEALCIYDVILEVYNYIYLGSVVSLYFMCNDE